MIGRWRWSDSLTGHYRCRSFRSSTGRRRGPHGRTGCHRLAVELMDVWRQRFRGQEMTLPLLDAALRPRAAHQLSFWDYAIIAAARALGCRRLHSENMGDGREIDGVR